MTAPTIRALVAGLQPFHRAPGLLDTNELLLSRFADARGHGTEAVTGSGVGLELASGERILASALSVDRPKGHEHRLAVAITDRRTAISGWSDIAGPLTHNSRRFSVLHADVDAVDVKTGMLKHHVALLAGASRHELPLGELVAPLGAFYQALVAQIPKASRLEPPAPLLTPGESDPTGARGAVRALWSEDPLARQMLEALERNHRERGMPVEMARDLAARVVLLHRSAQGAPAMRDGRWISPLSAGDLGHTLVRIFGAPTAQEAPQPGVTLLDFRLDPRRDVLADAVTALGVASYVAAGVGFAPGKVLAGAMLRKQAVTQLRVMFAEQAGGAAYKLLAPALPLEQCDARIAARVHLALTSAAYPVLVGRAERGWAPSYAELLPA